MTELENFVFLYRNVWYQTGSIVAQSIEANYIMELKQKSKGNLN
jgi:hypothetical protein